MKKLLTVLLAIVTAVCLVNLNSNHTKADDKTYHYKYTMFPKGTSEWEEYLISPDSFSVSDKITIVNNHPSKNVVINLIDGSAITVGPGKSKTYTVKYAVELNNTDLTVDDNENGIINIRDAVNCDEVLLYADTTQNGVWKYNSNDLTEDVDPKYSTYGITHDTSKTTPTTTLSKNLFTTNQKAVLTIKKPLNIVLGNNISLVRTGTSTGNVVMDITSSNLNINGKNKTLFVKSTFASPAIANYSLDLSLENITFKLDSKVNGPCVMLRDLILGDNCTIEITQKDAGGYALYTELELSEEVKNNCNILGKVNPDDSDDKLKPVIYNENTHIYQVEDDDTNAPVNAKYILITSKQKPTPTPDPGKKDESCEKVIGPSWHWNNDKGVCEEYTTVGTSTR